MPTKTPSVKSVLLIFASCVALGVAFVLTAPAGTQRKPAKAPAGIHKIKHVIVIMQENRSFDHYFGTYPGAHGFPRTPDGDSAVCSPDLKGACEKPYHDTNDLNAGGPHGQVNATADVAGGKMDGFVVQAQNARRRGCVNNPNAPLCSQRADTPDVMGYHDGRHIPNYWAYARNFVLQDHMYEPNASWSLPAHLFMVSEWSARCTRRNDPFSCVNALQNPGQAMDAKTNVNGVPPKYAWTDLTYLLHKHKVSWRYYVFSGTEPDCEDDQMICDPAPQSASTPGIWNPLPYFTTVRRDGQLGNIKSLHSFFVAAHEGTLPAVSWVAPSDCVSEHPPSRVSVGQ